MKRLLTMWLALFSLALFGQNGVTFRETIHDLGTINESDGVVVHTFEYTNSGTEPFVITDVSVSCGCTLPSYSTSPLGAGQSAEFTVRFDPADRPGRFSKSIYITSNQGVTELIMSGIVTPRARTMQDDFPYPLAFGARASEVMLKIAAAPRGRTVTRSVEILNSSPAVPMTVTVDASPGWLSAETTPTLVAAGARAVVSVSVESETLWGEQHGAIGITINGVRQAEKIRVTAIFIDDFTILTPTELQNAAHADFSSDFYHFSNQAVGRSVSREFKIKNSGSSPLHIRHIGSNSPDLTWQLDRQTIAVGASATLRTTLKINSQSAISQAISVVCSDPRQPFRQIRLMANGI